MKKILLDLGYELLSEKPPEDKREKKVINAEKKLMKELKEKYPIKIEVKFQETCWWIS